jgi:hypothetical protein
MWMSMGDAQAWFAAGAIVVMVGGAGHMILALVDTVRPTYFAPIETSLKPGMEATGIRLVPMIGGSGAKPSMWRVWLGINIGIGLGALTIGLLCLLIATHDFRLVEHTDAIRLLTLGFSIAYLVLSLRFWFYLPAFFSAGATACFAVAMVLST